MAAASGVVEDQAFVTLATTDTYALGALVLAHSLRRVGTSRQLVVMISPGVSPQMRQQLSGAFDSVVNVDILDSRDTSNLALLTRPDLGVTFTKLHCWRLTQFTKCVFLDADTLVLQNVDELFDREELSAAPDAGWPDCFNSGVFVFRPSNETYNTLLEFAVTQGSFDGGDQGLLNLYFSDWATKDISKHLPFIYNVVSQAFYSYLPAFRHFGEKVKIAHFIGAVKPWHHTYNTATGQVEVSESAGHHAEYLKLWWEIFMDCVQEVLDPSMDLSFEMVGLAGELASLRLDSSSEARKKMNDRQRQFAWERGQIDYKGVDAFDNIMKQLDATISAGPKKEPSPPPAKEKTPPPPMKPAPPKSALKQPQKKEVSTFVMSVGK